MINSVLHLTVSTQKEQRQFGNIATMAIGSHQHSNRPAKAAKSWWAKVFLSVA
jgi:hypothetical protein